MLYTASLPSGNKMLVENNLRCKLCSETSIDFHHSRLLVFELTFNDEQEYSSNYINWASFFSSNGNENAQINAIA